MSVLGRLLERHVEGADQRVVGDDVGGDRGEEHHHQHRAGGHQHEAGAERHGVAPRPGSGLAEHIADPPCGVDEAGLAALLGLASQVPHVDGQ